MKDSLYGELTVIGMKGSESFVERVDEQVGEARKRKAGHEKDGAEEEGGGRIGHAPSPVRSR